MKAGICFLAVLTLMLAVPFGALADYGDYAAWADAADRIDQYLDTAFEQYLAGENSNLCDHGFERADRAGAVYRPASLAESQKTAAIAIDPALVLIGE